MQLIRSEVTRLFAIGFIAGALMVGVATGPEWSADFAPQAQAQETAAAPAE